VKRGGEQCKKERKTTVKKREEVIAKKKALVGRRDKKWGLSWSLVPILF
jgi:hypothetical protein